MDRNFTVVSLVSKEGVLNEIVADPDFAEIEAHPQFGRYGRAYYPAYWGDKYRDCSFAVLWQDRPIIVALCGMTMDVLGLHGLPMRLYCRPGIPRHVMLLAAKTAMNHVDEIAAEYGAREISLREPASPVLSPISEVASGRHAAGSVTLNGMVDLLAGPAVWKHALRKSFHQFVNWGRRTFTIDYVNGAAPDQAKFDRFREFHAQIAGRVTRPKLSWDIQFNEIAQGHGELILAYWNDKLVAGSMFIDGTDVTIYMNGVYDRDLDKPLAHYMIWHGIERAHARGQRMFQLGDIHLPGVVDEKRYSIGYFKRGFATHFESSFVWTWEPVRKTHHDKGAEA